MEPVKSETLWDVAQVEKFITHTMWKAFESSPSDAYARWGLQTAAVPTTWMILLK